MTLRSTRMFRNSRANESRSCRGSRREDIRGVVFLSGDRHTTELSELTMSNGRRSTDLTVSPLTLDRVTPVRKAILAR